jgi:hypothetical protein
VSDPEWRAKDRAKRQRLLAEGFAVHGARGLCGGCYTKVHQAGELIDYERRTFSNAEAVSEYDRMADPERSIRYNCHQIAPRIGMTFAALERAVNRRNVRQAAA